MKTKKTIKNLAVVAALSIASIGQTLAQSNLGAACGCPSPVSARPTVLISTLATNGGALDGELIAANTVFTCDKTWILDKKIYVPNGKTLTIQPGTVIKGNVGTPSPTADATALVVSVGGKIFASGSEDCQIVFTAAADNLDGSFPISTIGQWGGIAIAGKATNNLTLAANGPFQPGVGDGRLCVSDGIGTFEGFASSNAKNQFGVAPAQFDDNDNSGILKYVSIRHSGAILQVGGEINALSLGSVGRGTTIEHLEVVSCADDNVELYGGTVNLKYITMMFGNDDGLDWDDGWRGNVQFLFNLKTDNSVITDNDNGMEGDGDDQRSNLNPRSRPVIYNATMIGNSKVAITADNSGPAAIQAKELTEGEINNSVFANFRYGLQLKKVLGARAGSSEAYHNWSNSAGNGSNSLKVKCNTFTNMIQKTIAIESNGTGVVSAADSIQFFTTDLNQSVASIAGFDFTFIINNTTNVVTNGVDAIPNPAISTVGCPTPPADGFFKAAPYRGAFEPNGQSWLSPWAYATVLKTIEGLQPCPTDINLDGITNNSDFLDLLGKFNQTCQ